MPSTPDFTSPTLFPPFTSLPELEPQTESQPQQPQPTDDDDNNHRHDNNSSHQKQKQQQEEEKEETWYLLAEITHNMTLTKPTLVLADRAGTSFALVFADRPAAGPGAPDLGAQGFRRGHTVAVARARRTPGRGGGEGGPGVGGAAGGDRQRRGFVRIGKGEEPSVRALPGSLERVLAVGEWLRAREAEGEGVEGKCESCGGEGEGLSRCTGCGEVRYCSKVSECETLSS